MVDSSKYFTYTQMINTLPEEATIGVYQGFSFMDCQQNFEVENMQLSVSSHRLTFAFPNNPDMVFLIDLSAVHRLEEKHSGFFSKTLDKVVVHLIGGDKVKIKSKRLKEPLLVIQSQVEKKTWQRKQEKQSIYMGIQSYKAKEQNKAAQQGQVVAESFNSFEDLFKNVQELKQVSAYLQQNIKQGDEQQQSETDRLLNKIGMFEIVTKDESGVHFYRDLCRQVAGLAQELITKQGGMVSLIDLFYLFNRRRQTLLISPKELLKACDQFQKEGVALEVVSYQEIKVVQQVGYSHAQDYQQNIAPYLSPQEGITIAGLAKRIGVSALVAELKVNNCLKEGLLCLDDRIEGQRYFSNVLLY